MNISDYLMSQRDINDPRVREDYLFPIAKRIECADGFSISVQATHGSYCSPRTNIGPWGLVECGYPSAHPGDALMQYAEDPERPLDTVYGYVPIKIVEALIESHGGALIAALNAEPQS